MTYWKVLSKSDLLRKKGLFSFTHGDAIKMENSLYPITRWPIRPHPFEGFAELPKK